MRHHHKRSDGQIKVQHRTIEAALVHCAELDAKGRPGRVPYTCPVCEYIHIGRNQERQRQRRVRKKIPYRDDYSVELGARVAGCLFEENSVAYRKRLVAIMARLYATAKRRYE